MSDFSLTTLYVLPNGSLAVDGFKRENLKPTQFGIFNSRYKAVTSAGEARKSPYIVFGQGRVESVPGLTHKYSDKVSAGSLIEWYKTNASPVAKNQVTYAGFDGVDNSKTIKVGYDEQVSLTIRGRSLYIDNAFAYGLTRTVTVTTPCGADCSDNCDKVDPRWVANKLAEGVNNEPMLSKFYVATPVFECVTPPSAPTTIATATYEVAFCDNGDAAALADVQAQYPNDEVKQYSRAGSISTYRMERLASAGAPASVLVSKPVQLSVCSVCPAGYTFQGAQEQYIIETPLSNQDLNSAADQQTFANTVKAGYVAPKVFDGATAVDPVTNQITSAAHGLVAGQAVVYSNGGGTTVVGLTSGSTYYVIVVDANNVKLATSKANALAGTAIDITADGVGAAHSLTVQSFATFLENKGGSALILLSVDALSAALTIPVLADKITALDNVPAVCNPPAGAANAWTAVDAGYKVQRTLSITLTDDCNTTSTLAQLTALYPNETVTLAESANCVSRYQLVQTSESTHEDCINFPVPPKFRDVQPFRGLEFTVVEAALTGADCVAGVKIQGKSLDKYGNPCDPIAYPYEFDKLTFEVFAYVGAPTSQDFITFDRCDNIPITKTQNSTFATGSGDEIFMLEKRYHSEQTVGVAKHIYHESAYNGGFVRYSDSSKFYDTYVLKFKAPDLKTWDSGSAIQDESVIIAVPAGTGASLEAFLLGYFGPEKFTAGILLQSA